LGSTQLLSDNESDVTPMSKVRNGEVSIVTPLDDLKQNTNDKLQTLNKTQ